MWRGDVLHVISMISQIEMKLTFNKLVAAPFGRASVAPRGTVWSGSAACRLYISRVSHRSSSVIRSCIPIARFPHVQVFIDSLMLCLCVWFCAVGLWLCVDLIVFFVVVVCCLVCCVLRECLSCHILVCALARKSLGRLSLGSLGIQGASQAGTSAPFVRRMASKSTCVFLLSLGSLGTRTSGHDALHLSRICRV